jgi:GNAT superfamily N-acetyltransferase
MEIGEIGPLSSAHLGAAASLLAGACRFDRASEVAAEKLFGPSANPSEVPQPLAAWHGGELAGVASVAGSRLRVLAVAPAHRGRGLGSRLLAACEARARAGGATSLSALDQPGNYLAPGIDERNLEVLGWLERRGFVAGSLRCNLLVDLGGNSKVSPQRAEQLAKAAAARGYLVRRATAGDGALLDAIATEFGGTWPFEVERALTMAEPGVHLAERDGVFCAFAAHDGNNQGLGWFGPAGTWPAHREQRLGEAVLLACLVDVARQSAQCEISWVGPEAFYEKSCGVAGRRMFVPMRKALR